MGGGNRMSRNVWLAPALALAIIAGAFAYDRTVRIWFSEPKQTPEELLISADNYFYEGLFSDALQKYEEVWNEHALPEAAAALATVNYYLYKKEEAKRWHALVLDSERTESWKNDFHRMLGQKLSHSWRSLRPLIVCAPPSRIDPTGPNLILANLDSKNAVAYLAKAGELSPECDEVQWMVTENIMQNRGIPEALEFVAAELHKRPSSSGFLAAKAQLLIKKGDTDSGKAMLQDAIRANSKNMIAFILLGGIAAKDESNPRGKDLYQHRGCYGNYSMKAYEMYTKLAPIDPYGFMMVGDEHFRVRDYGAAAKNYLKALSIAPNIPGANLQLAKIYRQAGELKSASAHIDRELMLYPESKTAIQFRQSIPDADKM
jgi:tetratricopeptide (TPR) repeat protein